MAEWRRERRRTAARTLSGPAAPASAPTPPSVTSAASLPSPGGNAITGSALEPQLPRFKRLRLGAGTDFPPSGSDTFATSTNPGQTLGSSAPRGAPPPSASRDAAPTSPPPPASPAATCSTVPTPSPALPKNSARSQPPTPAAGVPLATPWPARALKVNQHWVQLLLDGSKTWEVRSYNTKVRGRVALASTESKLLHGDVEIVDCTEIPRRAFAEYVHKHRVADAKTIAMVLKYKAIFAWHVASPRTYVNPTPFPNPTGAVIFVHIRSPATVFATTAITGARATPSTVAIAGAAPSSPLPPTSPDAACSTASDTDVSEERPKFDGSVASSLKTDDPLPPPPAAPPSVPSLQDLQGDTMADVRAYDAGIVNLGLTCFLNALLTCLSSAVPFVDRLLRHLQYHNHVGRNAHCLRCCLANDLAVLCEFGRCDPFTPSTAERLLEWAPDFVRGEQQCVGEAFTLLLGALHTEDLNALAHLLTPANALDVGASTVAAEHFDVAWIQARHCLNAVCGDTFTQTSRNLGLQLELPPSQVTVLELLEEHFKTEQVDDFVCDRCNERGSCEVRKTVTRWPQVLVLHVKRFHAGVAGLTKLSEPLFFEELLQSELFGVAYSLQAVAVHTGFTLARGHYFAFVHDSLGQWVFVNDEVTPTVVPFDTVQGAEAYLLVYQLLR